MKNAVLDVKDFLENETITEEFIKAELTQIKLLSVSKSVAATCRDKFRVQVAFKTEASNPG